MEGCPQPPNGHRQTLPPAFPHRHLWLEELRKPRSVPPAKFTCLEMGRFDFWWAVLTFELGLQL